MRRNAPQIDNNNDTSRVNVWRLWGIGQSDLTEGK